MPPGEKIRVAHKRKIMKSNDARQTRRQNIKMRAEDRVASARERLNPRESQKAYEDIQYFIRNSRVNYPGILCLGPPLRQRSLARAVIKKPEAVSAVRAQ